MATLHHIGILSQDHLTFVVIAHCYIQIFQDQVVCFKSDQSLGCPSKMDLESWSIFKQSILDAGHTIQYSVTPRVKNLDIVLTLDVALGKITLFLSNEMDYFQIT